MKQTVSIFVLLVFAAAMSFAKTQDYGVNTKGNQKITNGPVIESVSDHSAMIAWTTDKAAGSYIAYGTDANKLDQKEAKAWGGTNHRLELKNLQPSTTYYFQVRSENARGSGADVESPVASFQTVAKGAAPNRENRNVGVNGSSSSASALPQSGQAASGSVAQITDGPILESVSDDDAVIAWSTKQGGQMSIKYGTDKNNLSQTANATDKMGGTNHRVKLDNLQPTSTYYFQVVENGQPVGNVLDFKTLAKGQRNRQNVNLGVKK
jgi:phosphodiesterase/alkaline phosphatase D-like protein